MYLNFTVSSRAECRSPLEFLHLIEKSAKTIFKSDVKLLAKKLLFNKPLKFQIRHSFPCLDHLNGIITYHIPHTRVITCYRFQYYFRYFFWWRTFVKNRTPSFLQCLKLWRIWLTGLRSLLSYFSVT